MSLPRSLVQPFRKNTLVIGAGWRAYFAPYNVALGSGQANTVLGPTILDLTQGPYDQNQVLPAGWYDLGWIKDFKLTPATKIGSVRSGYRGAIRAQYRGELGESFEFKFRESARMQWKVSTGNTIFNLLKGVTPTTVGPLSASGAPATAMVSYTAGSSPWGQGGGVAPTLTVASASGANISVGSYIVCDIDYNTSNFGYVGDAGAPVFPNAVTDVDYIRKTSDYVARVTGVAGNVLTLDLPFIGGGSGSPTGFTQPQAGSKVQAISGWVSREGSTGITEWTGLFLMDTLDQAQIAVYYPHISIAQNRDVASDWAIENIGTTDLGGHELDASYQALAFDDPLDGQTAVGYKVFYPRPLQNVGF